MTIRYQLRFEDLLALQKNVIDVSYTHEIKRMYFKWLTTILLAGILFLILKTSTISLVVILALSFAYYLIAPKLYNKISFLKLKNQMKTKDYSHLLGSCRMIFSDDGILRVINGTETYFAWNQFEKLEENSQYFFLYQSDLDALIIPKQTDDTEVDTTFNHHHFIKQAINSLF